MRALMRDMVPSKFEDIIALIALFRPGPLQSDMHRVFVDQKHGRKVVTYPHHSVEEILRETYGVIVYQEQAMQIAQVMAGYTGLEADELRKAMAKKKSEIMFRHREKFIEGCKGRDIEESTATGVFDLIEKFGGYGFNKSHSTAYALVSYQTAYLKTHYPSEYMAALMTIYMDNQDRLVEYINECRRMGLEVRPPDINLSAGHFTPGERHVLFGLSAVRNVGSAVVDQIVECRDGGSPFASFMDFCDRVPASVTNKKTVESLIKAGAFDSVEQERGSLLGTYDLDVSAAQRRRRDREEGQGTLFGDAEEDRDGLNGSGRGRDAGDPQARAAGFREGDARGLRERPPPLRLARSARRAYRYGDRADLARVGEVVYHCRRHDLEARKTLQQAGEAVGELHARGLFREHGVPGLLQQVREPLPTSSATTP